MENKMISFYLDFKTRKKLREEKSYRTVSREELIEDGFDQKFADCLDELPENGLTFYLTGKMYLSILYENGYYDTYYFGMGDIVTIRPASYQEKEQLEYSKWEELSWFKKIMRLLEIVKKNNEKRKSGA